MAGRRFRQGMRHVIGAIRGTTRKVNQLTGEQDRERGVPTLNCTECRFGLAGTDLGALFEHNGRLWFLFGDTVSSVGHDDRRPEAGDWIAWTYDRTPGDHVSTSIVDNAAVPGLPDHDGQGLVIVGSGGYRASNPYLAYLPLNDVEKRAKVRYYAGGIDSPVWSADERTTRC